MATAICECKNAQDVERLIDEEITRKGWGRLIEQEGYSRGEVIEMSGIRFVDWVNNQVYLSVRAPEFDY